MDYRKYRCNLWERLGCLAAGTAVAAAIAWLFYRSWYYSCKLSNRFLLQK